MKVRYPLLATTKALLDRVWFKKYHFWVTQAKGICPPAKAGFQLEGAIPREAGWPSRGSSSLELKWPQAQVREPVRMALSCHQLHGAFAHAFGPWAAYEAPMVQEKMQQIGSVALADHCQGFG